MSSEIARLCQEAVVAFTCHFDAGDYAEMEAHFSRHGVWRRNDGEIRGLEQLRAFLAQRGHHVLARHALTNLRTTVHTADRATVDSYVTAWRAPSPEVAGTPAPLGLPFLIGRYRDELVLEEGRWRIALRELRIDFQG